MRLAPAPRTDSSIELARTSAATQALPSPEEARVALARREFPWSPATLFAPMEGVTHPRLRELVAARGGVGVVCTEFVRVTATPLSDKIVKKHVVRPSRGALSVQVMGNDIEQMAEATEMVTRAGADIVDINLGCPAPKAVRKGVGSAMLKDRALLAKVLRAMRERTHLPLSAKMRAGYDDKGVALDVARTIEDAGVDFLTVHPRRRTDFYLGVADWSIIARIVETVRIPVVGNGDIWSAADARRMRVETGCHAVMMGRPVLRNPWIFRQLDALERGEAPERPTGRDVIDYYDELSRVLALGFPETSVVGLLKEQLRYLGRAVPDEGEFLREACRAPTLESIRECLRNRLLGRGADEIHLGPSETGLEKSGTVFPNPPAQDELAPGQDCLL